MSFKCQFCVKPYGVGEQHECSVEDLKARAVTANKSIDAIAEVLLERTSWSFSLDGNVMVKVAFHFPESMQLSKQHVDAFARIFTSVAENFIPEEANL